MQAITRQAQAQRNAGDPYRAWLSLWFPQAREADTGNESKIGGLDSTAACGELGRGSAARWYMDASTYGQEGP